MKIILKEAIKFHGHLGPYLVLGLLAGEVALEKLKCKEYFGLEIKVWGANKKPKSCLIDGLQLSTGATYGKGNIHKFDGQNIKIEFYGCKRNNRVTLKFQKSLLKQLKRIKTHKDSEFFAKKLYNADYFNLFELITHN